MGSTKYEERIQDITTGKHEQLSSREEVGFKEEVQVHRGKDSKEKFKDFY